MDMKKILIYWRGKVGQSLLKFCEKMKYEYEIMDDTDTSKNFDTYDIIIPSPGIPSSHQIYTTWKVVSELDFLAPHIPSGFQIHAITGTDGKSTTSWILYNFLKFWLPETTVYLGWNFGTPLADIVSEIKTLEQKSGHIVLEVSSFMAYHIEKFMAHNSILTNLHPDHLDWHKDLHEYYYAKLNLLGHTKNTIFYPRSAVSIFPELNDFPMESVIMGDDMIQISEDILQLKEDLFLDIANRQLYGNHNLKNIYFAALLAVKIGIPVKKLSEILPNIPALHHRLQKVSDKDQKIWIDDSKSTTAQSLYAALCAFSPKKVHLIVWGKDKGDPFDNLAIHLANHCTQCVAIGETKHIFLQAAHEAFIPAIATATIEEAVKYLSENTSAWDIILLSPGCASFDMFKNYEERAQKFLDAIG